MFKYARGEYHSDHFATFIKSHMNERDAEVEELQEGGIELTSEQMAVVRGKPNPKILKVRVCHVCLFLTRMTYGKNFAAKGWHLHVCVPGARALSFAN